MRVVVSELAKTFASKSKEDSKMSYLRGFCAVITLVCAFSFSAYAGNVPCDVASQPPPPEEVTSGTQSASEADFTVTDALLVLIEGVLLAP